MITNTETQASALATTYRQKLDACNSQEVLATTKEVASQARELLIPILQRWGVGLMGGIHNIWLYPNPMGGVAQSWGDGYLVLMYPELWQLVWGHFDRRTSYLLAHLEDIPLPDYSLTSDSYLWIAASVEPEDEYGDTVITRVATVPCKDVLVGAPPALYFGPVTRELYEECTACTGLSLEDALSVPEVGEVLEELPVYEVDLDGRWHVFEGNWLMDNTPETEGSLR